MRSPHVWIIDPDLLDNAKDRGELVRDNGREGWTRTTAAPICGITARALELAGPLSEFDHEPGRRAALARVSAWLGTLHPRHTIEQTSAINAIAETLRYDNEAVHRTFRARHWRSRSDRSLKAPSVKR